MKKMRALLTAVSVLTVACCLAACGDNSGKNDPNTSATPVPTPVERVSTMDEEKLNNYKITYKVTKPVNTQDADGKYINVPETSEYMEVGFDGSYLVSEDGGKKYYSEDNACFIVSSQSNARGWFSAHKVYDKADLKEIGTETVAGFETTHYQYKQGLFDIHMYVAKDFDATIKYENIDSTDEGSTTSLVVESLEFGTLDEDTFLAEYISKTTE